MSFDDLALARVLHVLGVIIWIGGVAMVTSVALPAIRRGALGSDRLAAFEAFESRFAWQARTAVLVVGLSGFYMIERYAMWWRFADPRFWWMHAMVLVWLVFFIILFIAEPLILHRAFPARARRNPDRAFAMLQRAHVVLLVLAIITTFGAVAGSHGWQLF